LLPQTSIPYPLARLDGNLPYSLNPSIQLSIALHRDDLFRRLDNFCWHGCDCGSSLFYVLPGSLFDLRCKLSTRSGVVVMVLLEKVKVKNVDLGEGSKDGFLDQHGYSYASLASTSSIAFPHLDRIASERE